jgi:hypothetical protein
VRKRASIARVRIVEHNAVGFISASQIKNSSPMNHHYSSHAAHNRSCPLSIAGTQARLIVPKITYTVARRKRRF